jgi:hypothetical protein
MPAVWYSGIQGFGGETLCTEQLEELGTSGRIILKWLLNKYCTVVWAEFIWLEQGDKCCEDGDEPVGFIPCTEFLDQRENSYLLQKDSASCC